MNISPTQFNAAQSLLQKKTPATGPAARDEAAGEDGDKKLRENVRKFVSQTFFGPMLRQMRNSPFKDDKFSGGRGGEAFAQMFDQQMADRLGRGSGEKLIDSIIKQMKGHGGARSSKVSVNVNHEAASGSEAADPTAMTTLSSAASLQRGAALVKARVNLHPSITK